MKNLNRTVLIIVIILFVLPLRGQDLFDLENSWKFADYLFTAHEYDLAANELERIVFLDSTNIEAKLLLIRTYRLSGKIKTGLQKTESFFHSDSDIPDRFSMEYGKMLISDKQFKQVEQFITLNNSLNPDEKLFLNLSGQMMSEKYKSARNLIVQNQNVDYYYIKPYSNLLSQEEKFNYKKPGWSSLMSAIVPGTGKIYSGYWKDGLMSLLFVGVFSFQSYRGFSKNGIESAYGWIFGGLAFGFYIGNIYGSAKAANQHNVVFKHKLHHQVEEVFNSFE